MSFAQRLPAFLTRRVANLIGLAVCCSLIGYALFAQYVQLLEPCPLCLFQRFVIIGLAAVFLCAALHHPGRTGARVYSGLQVVVTLAGLAVAARHIWIQAQPPGSVESCGASVGYLMQIMSLFDVIRKVFSGSGECQQIDTLLGVSWAWWGGISVLALGAWGAFANWKIAK
jgi:disulfide bond formation protein DsbB